VTTTGSKHFTRSELSANQCCIAALGVIARGVFAVPVLGIRSVAVITFVRIRIIGPAQPAAPPQLAERRGQDYAAVEAMVVEVVAVKSVSVTILGGVMEAAGLLGDDA
jgi:hypothetical protein